MARPLGVLFELKHLNFDVEAFRSEKMAHTWRARKCLDLVAVQAKIRFEGYYHSYRLSQIYYDQNSRIGMLTAATDILRFFRMAR